MYLKKVIIHIVILVAFLLTFSCSNQNSMVKPAKAESDVEQQGKNETEEILHPRILSLEQTRDEIAALSINNTNHFGKIASACGHYQSAYGTLPLKLEDLLNGFMLAWPECPFTNKPVKIIYQIPDKGNNDHVGKVYYERINDYQGNIYFLNVNINAYMNGQLIWESEKREIDLPIKQRNPRIKPAHEAP